MKRFLILATVLGLFAAQGATAADKKPVVVLDTTLGVIKIELDPQKAPGMTSHFLGYVKDKFYDYTIVDTVDPQSALQGGGLVPSMNPKPTPPPDACEEYNNVPNAKGTIAMIQRREIDDTMNITSRFLINLVDNKKLDSTNNTLSSRVFGKVIEGMDVLDKIANAKTARKGNYAQCPVKDIIIKSIRVQE